MVVLIDDNDDFRRALAANLRDDGHEVVEYAAPTEAPSITDLGHATVIITDYRMKEEDGLRFIDQFHAAHPRTRIIMVTAYLTEHLEAAAATRGFLTLLQKPVDYDELYPLMGQHAPV